MKNKVYAVAMSHNNESKILGLFKKYSSATRVIRVRAKALAPKLELETLDRFNFYMGTFSAPSFRIQVLKVNP